MFGICQFISLLDVHMLESYVDRGSGNYIYRLSTAVLFVYYTCGYVYFCGYYYYSYAKITK